MCKTASEIGRASLSSTLANRNETLCCLCAQLGELPQIKELSGAPKALSRLCRTLGPLFGPLRKPFVVFGDPQHRFLGWGVTHLLGDAARFFRAASPVLGVVDEGCRHISPQAATDMRSPVCPTFQRIPTLIGMPQAGLVTLRSRALRFPRFASETPSVGQPQVLSTRRHVPIGRFVDIAAGTPGLPRHYQDKRGGAVAACGAVAIIGARVDCHDHWSFADDFRRRGDAGREHRADAALLARNAAVVRLRVSAHHLATTFGSRSA
jgi:hypothetical protein